MPSAASPWTEKDVRGHRLIFEASRDVVRIEAHLVKLHALVYRTIAGVSQLLKDQHHRGMIKRETSGYVQGAGAREVLKPTSNGGGKSLLVFSAEGHERTAAMTPNGLVQRSRAALPVRRERVLERSCRTGPR